MKCVPLVCLAERAVYAGMSAEAVRVFCLVLSDEVETAIGHQCSAATFQGTAQ